MTGLISVDYDGAWWPTVKKSWFFFHSRYRHKYKVHNVALFRCEDCEIFFKSKKGYEGHLANKHAPKLIGSDGLAKSKKEVEGLNKVKTKDEQML